MWSFSQFLYGDDNVTVLGQQSAGTNGSITQVKLPGGFTMLFTGMQLLNPDGTTLHGVGIPLDIEVKPTAADFGAGIDPELKQEIIALGG